MHVYGASFRNRLAIIAVALAVPTAMALAPIAPARAATGTAPQLVCPPGNTDTVYCADYCPDATLVGDQCVAKASPRASDPGIRRRRRRRSG